MSIRIEWAAEDHCAVDLGAMALPARGEVCLSKGLRLRISSKGLTVCGGSHSEIQMPLQASPSGPDLAAILLYRSVIHVRITRHPVPRISSIGERPDRH